MTTSSLFRRFSTLALMVFFCPLLAFGQGSLTPPGVPGPTMKTLDQLEPRTPVDAQHTPGDVNAIYVISQPGSYYLTGNIIGVSGASGIRIDADNVTLDLNGFAMIGTAGTQRAINMTATHQNIAIFNGTVRGWASYGVYTTFGVNCQIHHLRLTENSFAAIKVGANSTVSDCVATANAGPGIFVVGSGNRIENNNLNYNTNNGIVCLSAGNLLIKNSASFNAGGDYNISPGNNYGQILIGGGPGFTNATAWANFGTACGTGQVLCGGACVFLSGDPGNCGSCGNACALANASATCISGGCTVAACNTGYFNCDNNPANGCEINAATDSNNCGGCGVACTFGNICVSSVCKLATCYNSIKDGSETDVDCGGSSCNKCASGKQCLANADCVSGVCNTMGILFIPPNTCQ